jgi:hypothetical protein
VATNLVSLMIKRTVVPYGMEWMRVRLRLLGKSGAALGRHLGIPKERVYEMFAGKRRLQQEEIGPTAHFLEWSVAELIAHTEGRRTLGNDNKKQLAEMAPQQFDPARQPLGDTALPPLVVSRSVLSDIGPRGAFMLFAERVDEVPRPFFLKFSQKAFALKVLDDTNEPVYRRWDTLIIDPDGSVIVEEDCLFSAYPDAPGGAPSIIGRLKASTGTHWTVHQYGTDQDLQLIRSTYPNAWPIVGRYNRR